MPPSVFADTFYWLALAQPRDAWHARALQWTAASPLTSIVTTDEVLTEMLNALARTGPHGPGASEALAAVHKRAQVVPRIGVETLHGVVAAVADVEEIGGRDDAVLERLEGQGPAWQWPGPGAALPQPVEETHDEAPFMNWSAVE